MKAVLAVILGLSLAAPVLAQLDEGKENPGSLFKPGYLNPLTDRVARHVGDILTVIVQEQSVATYAASTQTNKSENGSFKPGFVFDLVERLFRGFSTSSNLKTSGDGKTTHTNSVSTRMSVVVKEVLPGGNLLVEGHRSLTTNKDTETIVLSGIVRPFDIQPDNTILSTQIAEAKVALAGKGQIQDRQRKGLIGTLLDWLF